MLCSCCQDKTAFWFKEIVPEPSCSTRSYLAVLNSVLPAGHWVLQIEIILGFSTKKGYRHELREGSRSATSPEIVTCTCKVASKARNAGCHVMRLVQHQRQETFLNMLWRAVPGWQTAGCTQHRAHLSQMLRWTCRPQALQLLLFDVWLYLCSSRKNFKFPATKHWHSVNPHNTKQF